MALQIDTETVLFPPQALSVVHGSSEVPLLNFTLGELLDFQCEKYGSNECLVVPWTGARWTYGYLRQESEWLAKALFARGIRPGDRIGIMAGNCEQYVSVFFACMRIGCILVILNNTYTASEAQYALEFTGKHYSIPESVDFLLKWTECKIFFTTPRIGLHDNRRLLHILTENPGTLEETVILRGYPGQLTSYTSLIETAVSESDDVLVEASKQFGAHDVCNLQFTSGTTGNPKAAMLTHQYVSCLVNCQVETF